MLMWSVCTAVFSGRLVGILVHLLNWVPFTARRGWAIGKHSWPNYYWVVLKGSKRRAAALAPISLTRFEATLVRSLGAHLESEGTTARFFARTGKSGFLWTLGPLLFACPSPGCCPPGVTAPGRTSLGGNSVADSLDEHGLAG